MRGVFRRLFPDKGDFPAYLAMMAACVCGLLGVVWWAGIILPGTLLTLLSWPRWRELVAKAAKVDADYRDLGKLELMLGIGWGIGKFARAHLLLMVLTLKFCQDWLFAGLAYAFGIAAGWFWGIGPWGAVG
jgi:hypothetical protein